MTGEMASGRWAEDVASSATGRMVELGRLPKADYTAFRDLLVEQLHSAAAHIEMNTPAANNFLTAVSWPTELRVRHRAALPSGLQEYYNLPVFEDMSIPPNEMHLVMADGSRKVEKIG